MPPPIMEFVPETTITLATRGGHQQRRNQKMLSSPLPHTQRVRAKKPHPHGPDSSKGICAAGKVQDGRPKAPPSEQVFHKFSAQIPSPLRPRIWVGFYHCRGVGVTGIFSRTNPCHHARSQAYTTGRDRYNRKLKIQVNNRGIMPPEQHGIWLRLLTFSPRNELLFLWLNAATRPPVHQFRRSPSEWRPRH
jgi:hypothetical protein